MLNKKNPEEARKERALAALEEGADKYFMETVFIEQCGNFDFDSFSVIKQLFERGIRLDCDDGYGLMGLTSRSFEEDQKLACLVWMLEMCDFSDGVLENAAINSISIDIRKFKLLADTLLASTGYEKSGFLRKVAADEWVKNNSGTGLELIYLGGMDFTEIQRLSALNAFLDEDIPHSLPVFLALTSKNMDVSVHAYDWIHNLKNTNTPVLVHLLKEHRNPRLLEQIITIWESESAIPSPNMNLVKNAFLQETTRTLEKQAVPGMDKTYMATKTANKSSKRL